MSQPVTTNPFIIMMINMTIVFAVLIALGLVINLIHYVDPTRPDRQKQEAPAEPAPAPAPAAQPEPVAEAVPENGLTPEVVAVIAAALASYGYGPGAIHAIRPVERNGWKASGRMPGASQNL